MKDVQATELPSCDWCQSPSCGVYNAPLRPGDRDRGSWANLCGPCFQKHGLATSVTERRVLPAPVPMEVEAIGRRWAGEPLEVRELGDGVWRVWSTAEDGVVEPYLVYRPGAEVPCRGDDGRPCGDAVFPAEWAVKPDGWSSPDDWFTVGADGTYRGAREEVKVW